MSADPLPGWEPALLSAALVGTSRRPPPESPAAWPSQPDVPAEQGLLDDAALWQVARRAGHRPRTQEDLREPAPAEHLPTAPPAADQLLGLLLHQPPVPPTMVRPLLRLWVTCCADADRVPEPSRLPALLDRGIRDVGLREDLARLRSARLRWLVGLREEWRLPPATDEAPVHQVPDEHEWARTPAATRERVLAEVARHDPAAAVRLVRSSWATDRARERAALLTVLGQRPHPAAIDLLEEALDDSAVGVRRAALAVLDRLPTSPRAQRMAGRLAALVTVQRRSGLGRLLGRGGVRLQVERPEAPDQAAQRDGLDEPDEGSRTDHWLTQLAAAAPLTWWTSLVGAGPAQVWQAVPDEALRRGLVTAVSQQRDPAWAGALWPELESPPVEWLDLGPAEQREAHALRQLDAPVQRTPLGRAVAAEALLPKVPGPWSAGFSRRVATLLLDEGTGLSRVPVQLLASRLHPEALDVLEDARVPEDARRAVGQIRQHLSVSQSIREAFR
ncbi:DUF5691 domain-containing protein [Auraticoccus monumenti]|uniref:HEAT repeat-containing protein n=1 Tax=Auraticoccus monumenti TaxID=675864 RepID=A0A1G7ES80_9ACTN|nr:DUF5691 domain-containing protein [Auraticoccus monumenti]SDE66530.1 hypothetical protein SAMN04489747_4030 [Auraticoccus monumenti]